MERRRWNQHLLSVMEQVSRKALWKQRGMQHNGNASWKAILVERHAKNLSWNASRKLRGVQRQGKALCKSIVVEHHGIVVTECVTENISDHRMYHFRNAMESRHGWFHGMQHLWNVMERRHGNQPLLSVTEKV